MRIAIVILNWNGIKLLEKFLPSVLKYSENHPIYVIDNNSDDKSISNDIFYFRWLISSLNLAANS